MKDRYDGAPGKEAAISNVRQRRFESEHSRKNEFVKKEQRNVDMYAGRKPEMKADMFEFN